MSEKEQNMANFLLEMTLDRTVIPKSLLASDKRAARDSRADEIDSSLNPHPSGLEISGSLNPSSKMEQGSESIPLTHGEFLSQSGGK